MNPNQTHMDCESKEPADEQDPVVSAFDNLMHRYFVRDDINLTDAVIGLNVSLDQHNHIQLEILKTLREIREHLSTVAVTYDELRKRSKIN